MRTLIPLALAVLVLLSSSACRTAPEPTSPQDRFWAGIVRLCGRAFQGTVTQSAPTDTAFAGKTLVMHVSHCTEGELRIPFHVGEDRSRTWVVTRTVDGLRLKHDHRHRDGTEDAITQYGGETRDAGTATRQDFHADEHTARLIPAAAANVWTLELIPGERFAYALRREGTDRRFRAEFDLRQPVPPPPAPWGHEP